MHTRFGIKKIFFALLLASLCTPLVVVNGFSHPFVTGRELFFRTIMLLMIPFGFLVLYEAKQKKKRLGIIGIGIALMVAAIAISTIFSVDARTSFWGFAERFGGAISLFLYMIFGLYIARMSGDEKQRKILFVVWSAVWLLVALFAIVERYFPGVWKQFHGDGTRSISTIGNPIYLSSCLLLVGAFIESEIFRTVKSIKIRNICAVLVAFIFSTAILFAETRGANLGFLVGILSGIGCVIAWSSRRVKKIGVATIVFLLVFVGGIWLARNTAAVRSVSFLSRTFSNPLTDASIVQRFQLWSVGLRAVMARPFTGWGLDNFDTALDRLYIPNFTRYGVSNSYSDRAHNNYLDIAATTGVIGLIGYLLFLGGLVYLIEKKRRVGIFSSVSAAFLVGGLVAYAVSGLTAFDTQTVYFSFAFFAAMLIGLKKEEIVVQHDVYENRLIVLPTIVLVVTSIVVWSYGVVPLARGAVLVNTAVTNDSITTILQSAKTLQTFSNPYRAHQEQRIANRVFTLVGNGKIPLSQTREALQVAEDLLLDETQIRPNNFSAHFTLANVRLLQASHGYRTFDEAYAAFEKARQLSPYRQLVDYQEGNLYLMTKKYDQAIEVFRHALSLDTTVLESHWHLARGLAAAGKLEEAAKEFQIAWKGGFRDERPAQEFSVAVSVMVAVNDLHTTREIYEYWIEVDPDKADLYAALGTVDATLGDIDAAIRNVKKAIQLDPTIQNELSAFAEKFNIPLRAFTQ